MRSPIAAALLGAACFLPSLAFAATPACSAASLQGGFGVSARGTTLSGGAMLGVYRIAFDGQGSLILSGAMSVEGKITAERARVGHYRVSANCRGEITFDGSPGAPGAFPAGFLVVEADGRDLRFVGAEADAVLEMTGRRQFSSQAAQVCSIADLVGAFGTTGGGLIVGTGPVLGDGVMVFDGRGGVSVLRTLNAAGEILTDDKVQARYTVEPDCTGQITYLPRNQLMASGPPVNDFLVIDNDFHEFRVVGRDPGRVLAIIGQKQFTAAP